MGAASFAAAFTAVAAATLLVSGIGKLKDPANTRESMKAAGLPATGFTVRALAIVELALGAIHLFRPSAASSLGVACLYGIFTIYLVHLLRAASSDCGCGGRASVTPSWFHASLNMMAIMAAALVASRPNDVSLASAWREGWWLLFMAVCAIAATAYAAFVTVEMLPAAAKSYQRVPRPPLVRETRQQRADRELHEAGIRSGHPSLWADQTPGSGAELH